MNGVSQPTDKPPRVYKVKITKVAEINPEYVPNCLEYGLHLVTWFRVLRRFINGQQSQDESVLTVLTVRHCGFIHRSSLIDYIKALNVVIRMLPIQTNPFNARSFFTNTETRDVGFGFQLWRGYFQSLRAGPGRLLLNIDLSTDMFYKPGPLIDIALEVLKQRDPNMLSTKRGLPARILKELERFLRTVRVSVQPATRGSPPRIVSITSLTSEGAQDIVFSSQEGQQTNVAAYFKHLSGQPLCYPQMICAKVCRVPGIILASNFILFLPQTASGAVIPFERCTLLPGQLARKQIPPDVTRVMVEFSTKKPAERLRSIKNSFQVCFSCPFIVQVFNHFSPGACTWSIGVCP